MQQPEPPVRPERFEQPVLVWLRRQPALVGPPESLEQRVETALAELPERLQQPERFERPLPG